MGVSGITSTHVYRDTVWHSDSKERLGKVCVLRHEVRNLTPSCSRNSAHCADRSEFYRLSCLLVVVLLGPQCLYGLSIKTTRVAAA